MHWRLLGFTLLLPVLVACGTASANTNAGTPVKTNQVNMPPSYRFDPPVIEVAPGTSVTWTNNDNFTHSVQVESGEVHVVKPGERTTIVFDKPGDYPYVCTFHTQNMKGRVIVRT